MYYQLMCIVYGAGDKVQWHGDQTRFLRQNSNPANTKASLSGWTESPVWSYNNDSPRAHLTNEQPALTVSCAPRSFSGAKLGLTSTRSMATKLPVSCTLSQIKSPSRSVNPPRTGVPVLGAHIGSSASTSKER